MSLADLFQQVKNAIQDHSSNQPNSYDPNPLVGIVESLFNQHSSSVGQPLPASQDPYGDPANQFGNVRPASQDPYGDPADQGR